MAKILSDHNIEGQLQVLASYWASSDWAELWQFLDGRLLTMAGLGLATTIPDSELWRLCQEKGLLLITSNRNSDGDDSLEATMRRLCQADSLPILTISDADRVMYDREYAERVAVKVLEVLLDIDRFLGTRRLYIP